MEAARVPVYAVGTIHLVKIELALLNNVVVCHHDACKRPHETTITRKERKEPGGILDDVPWSADHAEDGDKNRSSEDVDILKVSAGAKWGKPIGLLWVPIRSRRLRMGTIPLRSGFRSC